MRLIQRCVCGTPLGPCFIQANALRFGASGRSSPPSAVGRRGRDFPCGQRPARRPWSIKPSFQENGNPYGSHLVAAAPLGEILGGPRVVRSGGPHAYRSNLRPARQRGDRSVMSVRSGAKTRRDPPWRSIPIVGPIPRWSAARTARTACRRSKAVESDGFQPAYCKLGADKTKHKPRLGVPLQEANEVQPAVALHYLALRRADRTDSSLL